MDRSQVFRRREYDLLRVFSMAAVVYLHTAASGLRQGEDPALWHISNLLSTLGSAAVPLFFMTSGALCLGSPGTDEPRYVLRHRLPRAAVPLLTWSSLALVWIWHSQGSTAALNKLLLLPSLTVITPYWFLYALIPLYLLSPLLKRMCDHLEPRHWRYLLLLWGVVTLGLGTLYGLVPAPWRMLFYTNEVYTVSAVGGYAGFFLLGACLDRLDRLPSRRLLWAAVLADGVVMALGTWVASVWSNTYHEGVKNYCGIFTAVLAAALFLLAKSYWGGQRSGRALVFAAENSFGVYLSHPAGLFCARALLERLTGGPPVGVVGQAGVFLLTLGLCFVGSVLAGSLPVACYGLTGRRFGAACRESNLFALRKPGETAQNS